MFTVEALDKLQEAKAIEASAVTLANAQIGNTGIALPKDFQLHNIESWLPHRRRMRGALTTASLPAFVAFCTNMGSADDASCFIDAEAMSATSVLNLGTHEKPGHCDFLSTLVLEKTAEYAGLLAIHGQSKTQQQIAEWMEDWEANITPMNADGEVLDLKLAITAVRKISIEANRKVGSEVKNLSSERSVLETINADTDINRPHFIDFKCTPYKDLDEKVFPMRLSIITGESTPVLRLHIRRFDLLKEEIAEEFADRVRAELDEASPGSSMPVYIGKYTSK